MSGPQAQAAPTSAPVPARAAAAAVVLVAVAVLAAAAWLAVAEVDVVVTARARAVPAGGYVKVQAPADGVVTRVAVHAGDRVEAGHVLVALAPDRGGGEMSVATPRAGKVARLHVSHPGEVVARGAALAEIIPADAPLVFEAEVADRDRGLIAPGLPVEIRVDAFPWTDHGALPGRLAAIEPVGDPACRATVVPDRPPAFSSATTGPRAVEPGMEATCAIRVGRKRLLGYVLRRTGGLRPPDPPNKRSKHAGYTGR